MVQEEYTFDDANKKKESKLGGIGKFIWNSETKEFCGRDGASWGKVSLFYAVFYLCLGSFFVGMLAVFVQIMPKDKPTYYGESSTMNARGINPGLGFRPQIDPEDHMIVFNPKIAESPNYGYKKYVKNLKNFLDAKYPPVENENDLMDCDDGSDDHENDFKNGKSCRFDYKKVFANSECNEENNYGFNTEKPCILVKVNKIISWKPANKTIEIKCQGETSVDQDNVRKVEYISASGNSNSDAGIIDSKYYPFYAQKSYRAPFIWARFDIAPNTLINIECKAYAANIDNTDRLNRRGQTKFSLYVTNQN